MRSLNNMVDVTNTPGARLFRVTPLPASSRARVVIDTDRNAEALTDAGYAEAIRARIPAGYLDSPDDCAGAALLLCSDAGRYIIGTSLLVDGGMHL